MTSLILFIALVLTVWLAIASFFAAVFATVCRGMVR